MGVDQGSDLLSPKQEVTDLPLLLLRLHPDGSRGRGSPKGAPQRTHSLQQCDRGKV